jgi:hypothetical protein
VTRTSTTTRLIHWVQYLLPRGFGSVLNLLVSKIPSLCFMRTRTKSQLRYNVTVRSWLRYLKSIMASWCNSSEQTMQTLMVF